MSTRSLTVFIDDEGEEIVVLYRHMDGFPDAHGMDLKEFLNGFVVVNGIGKEIVKTANGMGCLAAQVIAHFKKTIGNFYLYPAGTRDCDEMFIYSIYMSSGESNTLNMKVETSNNFVLYDGPVCDFEPGQVEHW